MPTSDGRIRGISIPSVPWHQPKPKPSGDLTASESAVRDADQLLWDKQTKP